MNITIIEANESLASDFLRFEQPEDKLFCRSESAAALSYLRVELARIRPGMADFLIRVATPKSAESDVKKSNVMVTIRGSKQYANNEGAAKIALTISNQMHARGDDTHDWSAADVEHLGRMLMAPLKFFASNVNSTTLRFSTDALA